jgi:uncharacterized membrane protein
MTVASMPQERVLFDATLRPHRSLSGRGLLLVTLAFAFAGMAICVWLLLAGAWPAVGFLGLDVALVALALWINMRGARMYERLRLTDTALEIRRVAPDGRAREWRLEPYWLRVEAPQHAEDDTPLALTSHGRKFKLGTFLGPEERLHVGQRLAAALADWRSNPRLT